MRESQHTNTNEINEDTKLLLVAKIGRLVGLNGGLKLHIIGDFPSIFITKAVFHTKTRGTLCVYDFHKARSVIFFEGYDSRDKAASLVHCELYSTLQESRAMCGLKQGEFLWCEIIGAHVYDSHDNERIYLGKVKDIERIGTLEYLLIETDSSLVAKGLSKQFLIPYIEQFVSSLDRKTIDTYNAFEILLQS